MARLRDIAERAGTSIAAVSLVLNDRADSARISEKTRTAVLDAARQLGYSPNLTARRLRAHGHRRRSLVVGLALPVDSRLSLVSRTVSGMQRRLADLSEEFDSDVQLTLETFRPGQLHRLRGVGEPVWFNGLVVGNTSTEDDAFLDAHRGTVPLVVFQRQLERQSTVDADNHAASVGVAQHLGGLGHRSLAIVTPGMNSQVQRLRYDGFVEGLRAAGLGPPEHVVAPGDGWTSSAYAATDALLARPVAERPTAVFATNDLIALGVMRAAHDRGLRMPVDLAVVGFDDAEFAPYTIPALTSVHLPVEEMAAAAVDVLLDLIQRRIDVPAHRLLPTRLVVRESCGARKEEKDNG